VSLLSPDKTHPDFVWRYFPWPEEESDEAFSYMDELICAVASQDKVSIEANAK